MPLNPKNPFLLCGLLALILLDAVTPWRWATLLHGAALLAVSAVYLSQVSSGGRWFAGGLAVAGAVVALAAHLPLGVVLAAATNGGQVLGFLMLVEILGAALQAGRYDDTLTGILARGGPSAARRQRAASAGSFVLSLAGMFMGAVPAAYYALGGKPGREDLPLAISASRGFGASSLVNPLSPLVVLAMAASASSLAPYLASAAPMALLLLALDWFSATGNPEATGGIADIPSQTAAPWNRRQTLGCLAAVAAAAPVYWAGNRLGMAVLPRIGLAVAAAGLGLGVAAPLRCAARVRTLPRDRFLSHGPSVPFFALGSLFGTVLVASHFLDPLLAALGRLHLPLLEFPLIVVFIAGLRWLGLAPVITLMILGPILAPAVSLSHTVYALSLTLGAVVAFLGSPLSGTNLFVASVSGVSPLHIAARIQLRYVGIAAAIGSVYAMALTRWLG